MIIFNFYQILFIILHLIIIINLQELLLKFIILFKINFIYFQVLNLNHYLFIIIIVLINHLNYSLNYKQINFFNLYYLYFMYQFYYFNLCLTVFYYSIMTISQTSFFFFIFTFTLLLNFLLLFLCLFSFIFLLLQVFQNFEFIL